MSGEDGYSHSSSSSSDYSDESDAEEQALETIHRIEQNDGTITKLDMGGETFSWGDDDDTGVFMSDDRAHLSRLGSAIALNTHLVKFSFHSSFYESAVFDSPVHIGGRYLFKL